MHTMKWINRLIPTNGTIIEKIDLNCVKYCKCEGEPQRLLYNYNSIQTIIFHYQLKHIFIYYYLYISILY